MSDYCGPECYKPGGHLGSRVERVDTSWKRGLSPEEKKIIELEQRVADLEREKNRD